MERLYNAVIDNVELSLNFFAKSNFLFRDIRDMIDCSLIKEKDDGNFEYLDIDSLYNYGDKLLREKNIEKAFKCFYKCYELDPHHFKTNFRLFKYCIEKENYQKSLKYLSILIKINDEKFIRSLKLYVYLMSFVYNLPDEYKAWIKDLLYKDVALSSDGNSSKYNLCISDILKGRFSVAFKSLLILEGDSKIDRDNIALLKLLLSKNIQKFKVFDGFVLDLAKNGKYQEIIAAIKESDTSMPANYFSVVKVCEDLIKLGNGEEIDARNLNQDVSFLTALSKKDYRYAKYKSELHKQKYNRNPDENALYVLVSDVCKGLDELDKKKKVEQLFERILVFLQKKDFVNFEQYVNLFLVELGCELYKPIILINLEIEKISNEQDFTETTYILEKIKLGDYKYDIYSYIQEFYIALFAQKFDVAELYYKLVSSMSENDEMKFILNDMKIALDESCNSEVVFESKNQNLESENDEHLSEIISAVINGDKSIDEACNSFGKSELQTVVIKLIFAREYYAQGNFFKGDLLILEVEHFPNKSQFIKNLLEEIRSNKRFYQNRLNDGEIPFARLIREKK